MANSKVPQFGSWNSDDNIGYTAYFETARKGKPGGPLVNPNEPQMNRDTPPPSRATPQARPTKPEAKQPKFGEWDEEEDVPYTAYFENPRKGGMTNPNDPQMNRDLGRPKEEPKQPKFGEWEAGEEVPYTAYFENNARRSGNPNDPQMNRDVGPAAAAAAASKPADNANARSSGPPHTKQNVVKFSGGPRNVEHSPVHTRAPGGRGAAGSQPSSFDSVQGTPGRTKPKPPHRGAQNPVGASIPAFGDWNKNPAQADGYTVVFDQLQKDRRGGQVATPSRDASSTPNNSNAHGPNSKDDCWTRFCGCFRSSG